MKTADDRRRVLLAVTESSPLPQLWEAMIQHLAGAPAELITIFFSDDRWRRAASLPFTREFSRITGNPEAFTLQRAEQLDKDVVSRTRLEIQRLAAEADLQLAFEILPDNEPELLHERLAFEQDVLIAHSSIASRPIYTELTRLKCRVLLVETPSG